MSPSTPPPPPPKSAIFRPLSNPAAYSALAALPSSTTATTASASTPCSVTSPIAPTLTSASASTFDNTAMSFTPSALSSPPLPDVAPPAAHTASQPDQPLDLVTPSESNAHEPIPPGPSPPLPALHYLASDDLGDDDSFTPEIVSGYHFNGSSVYDIPSIFSQQQSPADPNDDSPRNADQNSPVALPISPTQQHDEPPAFIIPAHHRSGFRPQQEIIANAVSISRLLDGNQQQEQPQQQQQQQQQQKSSKVDDPSLQPHLQVESESSSQQTHTENEEYYRQYSNFYVKSFQQQHASSVSHAQRDLGDDDAYEHHEHIPLGMTANAHPVDLDDRGLDDFLEYDGSGVRESDSFGRITRTEYDRDVEPDVDHRVDGIYNDLDDIGDWIASTAPKPGTDLTKQLAKATHTLTSTHSNAATSLATAALTSQQRVDDRRRDNMVRDKLDRATVENALDPRTRMILFRLKGRNRLRTLDGCVSTGKEANVYYATAAALPGSSPDANGVYPPNPGLGLVDGAPDAPVAVKVFKTSILQFKDRERYVAGEFRFRRTGYQRSSNRKMVQQWAEKEFRNQKRLQEAGIPAPIPLLLKPPVLIMSFFGKDGWPAPRLKDASLSVSRLAKAYAAVCMLMRRMFQVAHLVHGDLSEYNMLYWNGEVVIIDVSQSVEDDHQMALDFLRRDCANVNDFFRRSNVPGVLTVRELFEFVTAKEILKVNNNNKWSSGATSNNGPYYESNFQNNDDGDSNDSTHIGDDHDNDYDPRTGRPSQERVATTPEEIKAALSTLIEQASTRTADSAHSAVHDDEVFMRSYIPRTLQDVEIREAHLYPQLKTPTVSEEVNSNLFARLTGLSLSQKRERHSISTSGSAGSGSKRTSSVGGAPLADDATLDDPMPAPVIPTNPHMAEGPDHDFYWYAHAHAQTHPHHETEIVPGTDPVIMDAPSNLHFTSCVGPTRQHIASSMTHTRIMHSQIQSRAPKQRGASEGALTAHVNGSTHTHHPHQVYHEQTAPHTGSSSPCTSNSSARGGNGIGNRTNGRATEANVEPEPEPDESIPALALSGQAKSLVGNTMHDNITNGNKYGDVHQERRKASVTFAHESPTYERETGPRNKHDEVDSSFEHGGDVETHLNDSSSDDDDDHDAQDGDDSDSSDDSEQRRTRNDPLMGMSKKEWKKKVKVENRERREHKVPKHVKKRKETLAKRRRGTK